MYIGPCKKPYAQTYHDKKRDNYQQRPEKKPAVKKNTLGKKHEMWIETTAQAPSIGSLSYGGLRKAHLRLLTVQ